MWGRIVMMPIVYINYIHGYKTKDFSHYSVLEISKQLWLDNYASTLEMPKIHTVG